MLKSRRKTNHPGPLAGQLEPLEDTLLRHVFEQREQGITVQMFDLVIKASSLSPEFNAKHFVARCSAVKRFMSANSLVYCMGTHESQCKPNDVATEALDYMNLMRHQQKNHPWHNELANEARCCYLGRSGDDRDEEGGEDPPQCMVEDGV